MATYETQMAFQSHVPHSGQTMAMDWIRQKGLDLADAIEGSMAPCADRSAAIRKVREAVMTANAGIMIPRDS